MTAQELAQILAKMYSNAPARRLSVMPSLFGIRHAKEINECGVTPQKLVEMSGINGKSYHIEVRKGMKLRQWVVPIEPFERSSRESDQQNATMAS